ncbi:hypothetical protein DERP_000294 [Dermatophagoides pteronyssinus]|uniref:Uncharacterized protein n=1 Tax=Dermatophagoides pteronyssinus TaxID=6956 RepID=A0ABQ8IZV1_DERPT|nr:hypothetical protein DERP_000294 [Dermatophagoides pteronyssinus]
MNVITHMQLITKTNKTKVVALKKILTTIQWKIAHSHNLLKGNKNNNESYIKVDTLMIIRRKKINDHYYTMPKKTIERINIELNKIKSLKI